MCISLMNVSYNRLWKLLIDKKMKKRDLQHAAGVSTTVIAKLTKGQSVTTDVLLRICLALDCDFADIMEVDRGNIENILPKTVHNDAKGNILKANSFEQQIWNNANQLQAEDSQQ